MAARKKTKTVKSKYVARQGSPITDKQADIVGRELERMRKEGIPRTGEELVRRAETGSARLHDLFEWDNEIAGAKHRVDQARKYIASVKVIEVRKGPRKAYHSVVMTTEKGRQREYASREEVLVSDDALVQVSDRLYKSIMASVREAEELGLTAMWPQWKTICDSVRNNLPPVGPADEVAA